MKKTQKKIFGFVGLALVAITTAIASSLPSPEAIAASSFTDTLTVRVVGSVPDVNIDGLPHGTIFTEPNQIIDLNYANVEHVYIYLDYLGNDLDRTYTYYGANGLENPGEIMVLHPDYEAGDYGLALNLDDYGYGDYNIRIRGTGLNAFDEDFGDFVYIPAYLEVSQSSTDSPIAHVHYNPANVDHATIIVKDTDGKVVATFEDIDLNGTSPIDIELDFDSFGLDTNAYTVEIIAYDDGDNQLAGPFSTNFNYTAPESPDVPKTGALYQNLNISRTDYLVTGLLVFFSAAIFALVFTIKKRTRRCYRKATTSKRRR